MTGPTASASSPVRVAMIEDRPTIRVGVRQVIESQANWLWVWEAESVQAARLHLERPCDVLLLDLGLPDGNGLDLVEVFGPRCKVLVFSVMGDEDSVIRAIERGASGYLLKEAGPEEIIDAILNVQAGGAPLTPSVAAHLVRRMRKDDKAAAEKTNVSLEGLGSLTQREREVLLALARGYSYDETGHMLGISRHTIGHHVKQIYSKLAVNSRSQAVFEAVQAGWLKRDHE